MLRRTRGMLAVAGAAAFVVLAPVAAHATTVVNEGFETTSPSFVPYGLNASRDCLLSGHSGLCSLLLDPATTSTTIGAKRTGTISMQTLTTVTFWFKATSTTGHLDSDFIVTLNGGHEVRIHLTEGGPTPNNRISLYTSTGNDLSFGAWGFGNTWYQFQLHFDTANDTVYANGPATTSAVLSIPAGATSITSIDARAIEWNGTTNTVSFDDITVDTWI